MAIEQQQQHPPPPPITSTTRRNNNNNKYSSSSLSTSNQSLYGSSKVSLSNHHYSTKKPFEDVIQRDSIFKYKSDLMKQQQQQQYSYKIKSDNNDDDDDDEKAKRNRSIVDVDLVKMITANSASYNNNNSIISSSSSSNHHHHHPSLKYNNNTNINNNSNSNSNSNNQLSTMRNVLRYATLRLYKDLKMLVGERERTIAALDNATQHTFLNDLSIITQRYQRRFLSKLLENKVDLDIRIDSIWQRLIRNENAANSTLSPSQIQWLFSVPSSTLLTNRSIYSSQQQPLHLIKNQMERRPEKRREASKRNEQLNIISATASAAATTTTTQLLPLPLPPPPPFIATTPFAIYPFRYTQYKAPFITPNTFFK